jgi:segregation and condensation protein B
MEALIFCAHVPIKLEEMQRILQSYYQVGQRAVSSHFESHGQETENSTENEDANLETAAPPPGLSSHQASAPDLSLPALEAHLNALISRYRNLDSGMEICALAGGYQFLTKTQHEPLLHHLLAQRTKRKLSKSALETLALVAYKQPITKQKIEEIRGSSADYALQKLLENELIVIKGKDTTAGRPTLYGTSNKFMRYFGIHTLKDLPTPEEVLSEQEQEDALENLPAFRLRTKEDSLKEGSLKEILKKENPKDSSEDAKGIALF